MKNVVYFFLALLCALAGYFIGRRNQKVEILTDTITVYDTITYRKPIPVDSVVVRYESVLVQKEYIDTIYDSIRVVLPVETKHYQDTLFEAWVSGYHPSLDSIRIYQKTQYIKTKQKRWGLGIQGGYGITPCGPQPYIGIGVSYNLFSF